LAETIGSESSLGHLRVIELGDIPASYAARQLADLGADVIKIEPPGGDRNRLLPPFAGNIEHPERSLTFINANTNKRCIVLDLEGESDRQTFAKLLASAHLFVEATPLGYLQQRISRIGGRFDHSFRPHGTLSSLQRQRRHRQRQRRISLRPGR
jgi:crotonobetainyl-CoA:carnitine CoA-transferase CaiB-like acyl-CoA transferase